MALSPRKPKELVQLLDDMELKTQVYNLIAQTDSRFLDELNRIFAAYLAKKDISLAMLDHSDVEKAFKLFYKKNRMMGDFIKVY